jgi:hypothetical protein
MGAALRDDHLVCIGVYDEIRVVGNDDDLPSHFGCSKALNEVVIDRLGIKVRLNRPAGVAAEGYEVEVALPVVTV